MVVFVSITELYIISAESSAMTAFRTARIFRIFRVLRFQKVFKKVKYMGMIVEVMMNLFVAFFYILLLVALFIYIYALLGMEIFGGKLEFEEETRISFDSFGSAFNSAFQITSVE